MMRLKVGSCREKNDFDQTLSPKIMFVKISLQRLEP